jgi:hypothetical protein
MLTITCDSLMSDLPLSCKQKKAVCASMISLCPRALQMPSTDKKKGRYWTVEMYRLLICEPPHMQSAYSFHL